MIFQQLRMKRMFNKWDIKGLVSVKDSFVQNLGNNLTGIL
jgi:hypothetical protein